MCVGHKSSDDSVSLFFVAPIADDKPTDEVSELVGGNWTFAIPDLISKY
jgi:hypothetical protein